MECYEAPRSIQLDAHMVSTRLLPIISSEQTIRAGFMVQYHLTTLKPNNHESKPHALQISVYLNVFMHTVKHTNPYLRI